jgi:2-amino-4-hydroxy-6-hydroxymethyldihydropteridine diphosphokinase
LAIAYISLGSNLGNRLAHLKQALRRLEESGELSISKTSPVYETQPVGPRNQSWFLNLVVEVQTYLDPHSLLEYLSSIENQIGRKREESWGPRKIDLDILLYDNQTVSSDRLTIPHPRMQERKFVLLPLSDIAPHALHPVLGKSVKGLLDACQDTSAIRRYAEKT